MSEIIESGKTEVRRVQALTGKRSLTVVLAKTLANHLGIGKGDLLKCYLEGRRLILEKAEI